MKTYLLIGASSGIAQALTLLSSDKYIGISTKPTQSEHNFASWHQVQSHEISEYPEIEEPLDGLVYFPGSIVLKPFQRFTDTDFRQIFETNTLNAALALQKYLPNLKRSQNQASVVFISTVAASVGLPFHTAISMAKGALQGLTVALAAELAPTIRVNCVAPSLTETAMAQFLLNTPEKKEASDKRHPLKRIGTPQDIAQSIYFLLSTQSSWMTGQILHCDGGISNLKI